MLVSMYQQIYFIAAPEVGRFKIGRTGAFDVRFSALQSSSPVGLEPIYIGAGPPELEKLCRTIALEDGFIPQHGEWFLGTPPPTTCIHILMEAERRHRQTLEDARIALERREFERRTREERERRRRKRIDADREYFANAKPLAAAIA